MASITVVKVLVAGLAMYFPQPDGQMTILLPEVKPYSDAVASGQYDEATYLPGHTAWFGYFVPTGGAACNPYVEVGVPGGKVCWKEIKKEIIEFPDRLGEVGNSRTPRDNFMVWDADLPGLRQAAEMVDFSWLASMEEVDPEFKSCRPHCGPDASRKLVGPVQAYADFKYTRKSSCRLAGFIDERTKQYVVPTYVFGSRWQDDRLRGEQALATAVEFEIETQPIAGKVTFSIGGAPLEITVPVCGLPRCEVQVALIHDVPPEELLRSWVHRLFSSHDHTWDDHFRGYYRLASGEFNVETQRVPRRSLRAPRYYPISEVEAQCKTPFLRPISANPEPVTPDERKEFLEALADILEERGYLREDWAQRPALLRFLASLGADSVVVDDVPAATPDYTNALFRALGPPLCPGVTAQ